MYGDTLVVGAGCRILWLGLYHQPTAKRGWMRIVQIILLAAALVTCAHFRIGHLVRRIPRKLRRSQLYTNQNGR